MPRPRKPRFITTEPGTRSLVPGNGDHKDAEPIILGWDEYEVLRLIDLEGLFQDAAGELLGISRQTVGRILTEARRKLTAAIVEGRPITVEGGDAYMMEHFTCADCGNRWMIFEGSKPSRHCPACGGTNVSVSQMPIDQYGGRCGRRRKEHGRGRGGRGGRGEGGGRGGGGGRGKGDRGGGTGGGRGGR